MARARTVCRTFVEWELLGRAPRRLGNSPQKQFTWIVHPLRYYTKNQTHPERNTGVTTRHYTSILIFSFFVSKIIIPRHTLKKDLASIEFGLNIESRFINNRSVNVWNGRLCKALACNRIETVSIVSKIKLIKPISHIIFIHTNNYVHNKYFKSGTSGLGYVKRTLIAGHAMSLAIRFQIACDWGLGL